MLELTSYGRGSGYFYWPQVAIVGTLDTLTEL